MDQHADSHAIGCELRHGRFALGVGCGGTPVEGFAQSELFDHRVPVIENLGIDLVIVDFVSAGVE